jgi:hypothetical protein
VGRLTGDELARMSMAERHEVLRRRLSRRGLLRAAAAGAAGLGAGPVLLAPSAGAVTSGSVPVQARWLALGEDPSTQIRVRWQVPTPVTGARVRYGTDTGYGQEVEASVEPLHTVLPTGEPVDQYYLGARLGGLTSGTAYHYQVVHDGVGTQDATFRTAPTAAARTPFSFTAFGDQGITRWAGSVTGMLARYSPAFHLLAGDVSYADQGGRGHVDDTYQPRVWDDYLAQITPVASGVPWMLAAGNHELEAVYADHGYAGLTTRFDFPQNGPSGCPTVYSFVYGSVGVVSLDSNDLTSELATNRDYSQGRQTVWARERFAALRADPAVDFVVALLHHCAYASSAAHGSDAGVRTALGPLFDEFAVDLVISGHNHQYERTDPIRGGIAVVPAPPGSTIASQDAGTTYLCVGTGGMGNTLFDVADRNRMVRDTAPAEYDARLIADDGSKTTERVGWSRSRFTGHGFVVADVDPGPVGGTARLRLRMVTIDGVVIDDVTLTRSRPGWADRNRSGVVAVGTVLTGAGLAGAVLLGSRPAATDRHLGPASELGWGDLSPEEISPDEISPDEAHVVARDRTDEDECLDTDDARCVGPAPSGAIAALPAPRRPVADRRPVGP